MLGILTGMPSIVFARSSEDSLLLERIFAYPRNYTSNQLGGFTSNVYIKTHYNVARRNFTLWLIPSMYSIADGDRLLVAESYNKLRFKRRGEHESRRQVTFSTIRHNRRAMPTIADFMTPTIYDVCIFNDHILSPFNRHNSGYYRYRCSHLDTDTATVSFSPRVLKNTQLVTGIAAVHVPTGRIITVSFNGEYDMIRFHTKSTQGEVDTQSLLPKHSKTLLNFQFVGNNVNASFEAVYNCPVTLPDSLDNVFSMALMDSLRPIPLTPQEDSIYHVYTERHKPDTTVVEDTTHHFNFVKDVLQDAIGDNLVTSLRYETKNTYMRLSPILDPTYVSYSSTHGFSYKLRFRSEFRYRKDRFLEFNPWCGYNFKYDKFYFTLPLYYHYNPKRNGVLTVIYGNGNRIGSSVVMDEIRREYGDSLHLDGNNLELFDDNYLTISNSIDLARWLKFGAGVTYHRRVAYNSDEMRKWKKPRNYYSFAPMLSVSLQPWRKGPVLSADYEAGVKGVLNSFIDYERWEFDASYKLKIKPLRVFNARVGGGFYSRKNDNYFVDYMHFRDNKLPGGWDDDWSGDFQLLNSQWYNESSYYARAHVSYESPLLVASWLPLLGNIVEKERFYYSILGIEHTRPYSEVGYGLSTRFISIGLFASFLNAQYQGFGSKFTFELFRRW